MEKKVLTKEEIEELKSINETHNKLIEQFGLIEYEIQSLKLKKQLVIDELKKISNKEITLGKILQEKYGEGTINPDTWEILLSK